MNWIEIIQLRSHSHRQRDNAIAAFAQLLPPARELDLQQITLLKGRTVENDLDLVIVWKGSSPPQGKSPLGLQLAAAFAEFGLINHSVWDHAITLPLPHRRTTDDSKPVS